MFYIDGNKAVKVSATYDADTKCAVFETDHFSNWYVDATAEPSSSGFPWWIIGVIVAVVAVAGVAVFIYMKKH